jgi:hypothetical protein
MRIEYNNLTLIIYVDPDDKECRVSRFLHSEAMFSFTMMNNSSITGIVGFYARYLLGMETPLTEQEYCNHELFKKRCLEILNNEIYQFVLNTYDSHREHYVLSMSAFKERFDIRNESIRRIKSKLS